VSTDATIENAEAWERAVLGCLLESPELWPQASDLRIDHFVISDHRKIFRAISELHSRNLDADIASVVARSDGVPADYISSLVDGTVKPNFASYVRGVRAAEKDRRFVRLQERLQLANNGDERAQIVLEMQEMLQANRREGLIQSFAQIPEIMSIQLGFIEPVVADLLSRGTVNLLSGDPGVGKSFVSLKLAVSVAMGTEFLGRRCVRSEVLMLDRENPLDLMQKRLRLIAGGCVPGLKVWGNWVSDPAPLIGDSRLHQIARAGNPLLLIFDSFVRFHQADENSASDMRIVMANLRSLADTGSTVLLLHHRPKSPETFYRGSSDILAGVDAAYSLEKDGNGLKLAAFKNRDSELKTLGIRADFAQGKFELADTISVLEHRDHVEVLREIITKNPGLSTNKIVEEARIQRAEVIHILSRQDGKLWRKKSKGKAYRYYPIEVNHDEQRDLEAAVPAQPKRNSEIGVAKNKPKPDRSENGSAVMC
jgi:AAA domain/DnaB-like helicase N terminal domain